MQAIIFVPPDPAARPWITICAAYCVRRGYHVVAIVTDWDDVLRMLKDDDGIDVVVIGLWEHLPADRHQRIEAVCEPQPEDPPERRRPTRR
ncbi:MAG TPA: hypothetical protein VFC19_49150 [Candidatus Limnocylindrales bacterium]|nr:hypothetical protein [Candidatus Limnocylindrales bacterium]